MWLVLMVLAADPVASTPAAVRPAVATAACRRASDCTAVRLPCREGWISVDAKSAPAVQAEASKRQRAMDCLVDGGPKPKSACVARQCVIVAPPDPAKEACLRDPHGTWSAVPGGPFGCVIKPHER